jgi:hypothetical protein
MELQAFLIFDAAVETRARILEAPRSEAYRAWEDLVKQAGDRRNEAADSAIDRFVTSGSYFRENLGRLRVTRMAAHYAATGELLVLPDPQGTTIRSAVRDGGMDLWNVSRTRRPGREVRRQAPARPARREALTP